MDQGVGKIFVEHGRDFTNESLEVNYEAIKLVITTPISDFKEKIELPRLTVKIMAHNYGGEVSFGDIIYHRRIIYKIRAIRTDFSNLINPEWFVRDEYVEKFRKYLELEVFS